MVKNVISSSMFSRAVCDTLTGKSGLLRKKTQAAYPQSCLRCVTTLRPWGEPIDIDIPSYIYETLVRITNDKAF